MANGATINPKFQPQNNKQAYLAYLCGLEINLPAPRTAEEALMRLLCENGGGNEGGDGIDVALTEQEALIAELQDVLKGKASGGGSVSAPLIVHSLVEGGNIGDKKAYKSITIGEGVTLIGDAFASCDALTSVTIENGPTSIGNFAFYYCTSLANVTIHANSVTEIGQAAFGNCPSLTSITLTASITSIDSDAFLGCDNLLIINVPWAEGAVEGAPWDATNATINYNYSEVTE